MGNGAASGILGVVPATSPSTTFDGVLAVSKSRSKVGVTIVTPTGCSHCGQLEMEMEADVARAFANTILSAADGLPHVAVSVQGGDS